MYEISVREHFDAAHALRGYQGRCENLHGHRFEVVVVLRAEALNEIGIAYDFAELKRHLREVVGELDHRNLNETPPFDEQNPSSENLARHIYGEMAKRLAGAPVRIARVEVWESPDACAAYIPG